MGSARAGFQGRIKMAFGRRARHGRRPYIVQENGPNRASTIGVGGRGRVARLSAPGDAFRGVPVLTNTPPRGPQRGPGQNQIAAAVEPLIDKAAKQLGSIASRFGASTRPTTREDRLDAGRRHERYLKDALDRGAELFGWASARAQRPAQRLQVRGVGVGTAYHGRRAASTASWITPDGKIHIHTGVGNLGTYSHTARRVAAEVLKANWDNCIVVRGDSSKHLPWNLGSSAATRRSR